MLIKVVPADGGAGGPLIDGPRVVAVAETDLLSSVLSSVLQAAGMPAAYPAVEAGRISSKTGRFHPYNPAHTLTALKLKQGSRLAIRRKAYGFDKDARFDIDGTPMHLSPSRARAQTDDARAPPPAAPKEAAPPAPVLRTRRVALSPLVHLAVPEAARQCADAAAFAALPDEARRGLVEYGPITDLEAAVGAAAAAGGVFTKVHAQWLSRILQDAKEKMSQAVFEALCDALTARGGRIGSLEAEEVRLVERAGDECLRAAAAACEDAVGGERWAQVHRSAAAADAAAPEQEEAKKTESVPPPLPATAYPPSDPSHPYIRHLVHGASHDAFSALSLVAGAQAHAAAASPLPPPPPPVVRAGSGSKTPPPPPAPPAVRAAVPAQPPAQATGPLRAAHHNLLAVLGLSAGTALAPSLHFVAGLQAEEPSVANKSAPPASDAVPAKEASPSALAVFTEGVQRLETDEEHVRERIFAAPFDDDAPWSPRSREQFVQRAVAITHEAHERCVTEIVAAERDGRAQLTPAVAEGLRELIVQQEEFTRAAVAAEVEASNELPARQAEIAKLLQSRKAEADTAVAAHAHEHLSRVAEADAPALSFLLGKDAARGHLHSVLDVATKPAESLAFVAGKSPTPVVEPVPADEGSTSALAVFTEGVQLLETDEEHVRERIFAAPFDDDAPWSPRSREQFVQRAVAITHEAHERCVTEIVAAERDGRAQLTPAVAEGLRELIVQQEEFTRAAVAAEVEASNELPARQAEIAKLLQSRKAEADTAVVAHAHEHLSRVAEADAPALSFLLGKDAARGHLRAVLDVATKPAESLAFVAGKSTTPVIEETADEASPSALAVFTEGVQRLETDEEHVRERIFAAPFDDDAPWSPRSREQFVQRAVAITHEAHERCVTEIVAAERDGRAQLTPAVAEGLRELIVQQEEFTRAAVAAEVEASNELPARQADIAKLLQSRKAEADTAVVAHAHEHLSRVAEADAPALSFLLGKDAARGHLHSVLDVAAKPAESLAFVAGKSPTPVVKIVPADEASPSALAVFTEGMQRLETDEEHVRERIFAAPFDDDAPWSPRSREQFVQRAVAITHEAHERCVTEIVAAERDGRAQLTPAVAEGLRELIVQQEEFTRAAVAAEVEASNELPAREAEIAKLLQSRKAEADTAVVAHAHEHLSRVAEADAPALSFLLGKDAARGHLHAVLDVATKPAESLAFVAGKSPTPVVKIVPADEASPSALAVFTEGMQRLETDEEHVRERIFAAPFDDDAPWSPRSREQFVQRAVAITHEAHERCVTEIVAAERDGRAQLTPAVAEGLRELIVQQEEFTRAAVAAEVEASNELPARQAEIAKLLQSRKAEADTAVVAHAHEHLSRVAEADAPALSFLLDKDAAYSHLHSVLDVATKPAESLAFVAGKPSTPLADTVTGAAAANLPSTSSLAVFTEGVQRLEADEEHVREGIFAAPFDDDAPWSPRSREQFLRGLAAVDPERDPFSDDRTPSGLISHRVPVTPEFVEGVARYRAADSTASGAQGRVSGPPQRVSFVSRESHDGTLFLDVVLAVSDGRAGGLDFIRGTPAPCDLNGPSSVPHLPLEHHESRGDDVSSRSVSHSALAVFTEGVQRLETDEEHVRERIFAAPFDDDAPWSPRSREQFVQRAVAITHEAHERCVTEIVAAERDGRAQLTPAVAEGLRELIVQQEEFTRAAVAAEVEASNELPARQAEIAKLLQSRKAEADTAVAAHAHEHLTQVVEGDAPALSFLLGKDAARGHLHAVLDVATKPAASLVFVAGKSPTPVVETADEASPSALAVFTEGVQRLETDEEHVRERIFAAPFDDDAPWSPRSREQFVQRAVAITHEAHERCVTEIVAAERDGRAQLTPAVAEGLRELIVQQEEFTRAAVAAEVEASNELPARQAEIAKLLQSRKAEADTAVAAHAHEHLTQVVEGDAPALSFLLGKDAARGHLHSVLDVATKPAASLAFVAGKSPTPVVETVPAEEASPSALAVFTEGMQRLETDEEHVRERIFAAPFDDDAPWSPRSREQFVQRAVAITHEAHERCVTEIVAAERDGRAQLTPAVAEGLRELIVQQEEFTRAAVAAEVEASNELPARQAEIAKLLQSRKAEADTAVAAHAHEHLTQVVEGDAPALSFLLGKDAARGHLHAVLDVATKPAESLAFVAGKSPTPVVKTVPAEEASPSALAVFTEGVQRLETDEEHVRERIFAAPFDDDAPWSPRSREQFVQRAVAITHEAHERCVTEIVAAEKDGRAQLTPAVAEGLRELIVQQEEFTRAAVAAEVEASNELPARQADIAKLLQSRKADTAVAAHAHEHLTQVVEGDAPALSFLLGKDAARGHLHAVLDVATKPAASLVFVAGKSPTPVVKTVPADEASPSALAVFTEGMQRLETDEEHVRERIFAAPFDDDAPWSPRSREQFVQRAVAITHEAHERCVTEIVAAERDGRAQLTPAVAEGLRELIVQQEEFTRAAVAAEVEASLPARQAEIAKLLQSRKAEADTAVAAHAHEHLSRVAEADAPALSFLLGKEHAHLNAVVNGAPCPIDSLAFIADRAYSTSVLPADAAPALPSAPRFDVCESTRESLQLVTGLGDGAALDFICQRRPAIVLPVGAPTCVASYDRETESGAQVCLCLRQCDIVRDTPETVLAARSAEWRCLVGEGVTYFRHCWSKKKVRNLAKEINKGVLTPSQELKHLAEWSFSKKKGFWKNEAAKKKCGDRCDVLREVAKVTAADSPYPQSSRVVVSPEAARAIGRCLSAQAKRFGEWERRRVEKAAQRVVVLDAKQLETHALESGKWKAKPVVGSDKQYFQKGKEKVWKLGEHLVTEAQDKCRLKAGVNFYPPDCTKCSARYAMPPPRWECPKDKTMVWQPDSAMASKFCHTCKKDVSKQRGQDHCRRCGHISCRTCIAHEMPLVGMGWSGATHLKVCKPCADVPRDL